MDPHNNINACLDTKTVFIDPDDVMRFDAEFELPVQLLRAGELVAFPTGTLQFHLSVTPTCLFRAYL